MSHRKKNTSKIKWNSVKTKLIVGMSAVAIIPTISIAVISNSVSKNVMEEELSRSTVQVTKQSSESLTYKMQGVTAQLQFLANNKYFSEFFQDPTNTTNGFSVLEGILKTNPEFAYVSFGSVNKDMVSAPLEELPENYDPTTRDWYIGAVEKNGDVFYSEPYQDVSTKQMVLTISQAVFDKTGGLTGVVAIDLDISKFSKSISDITIGKTGYMTVIGENGKYISHPDEKKIDSDEATKLKDWDEIQKGKEGSSEYELNGTEKFSAYVTNESTGWHFVSILEKAEITASSKKIGTMSWIFTLIFGLLSAITAYIFGKRISDKVHTVKDALETAAQGDFSARVSVNAKDEFNELEESFNDTLDQLSTSFEKIGTSSKSVLETSSQLSVITRETNAALSEVALAIEEIAQGSSLQARNVQVSSEQMRGLAQQLEDISVVTDNMNKVSHRSMELSTKGLEQVELLSDKSSETKSSTTEVASIVQEVNVRMEEINEIIEVITKITDQTNLLSLNASIESARAGEHGRGFAVVANEVRKLAEQSQASAGEIKRIVDSIKGVVKNAVDSMERTNQAVTDQDQAVNQTKSIFNDILAAVRELAQKADEVQIAIKESNTNKDAVTNEMESIAAVSQQTAAATEEVAASAEQISATMNSFTQHANGLKELSEQLDSEIKKFKL
ncbi:methyl-accepting chemotaxis protein [Neobacillus sp. K501]